ncbi:MAG: ComEC/Rec2 family competence protein [Paludibacter sp.]|nr:ComEC/Rec2 family competence protein [Paludibacter sp.]
MDFLNRTPFFRLLLSLIVGIIVFELFKLSVFFIAAIFILSFFIILLQSLIKKSENLYRFRWLFGLGIMLFFVGFGAFLSFEKAQKIQFIFPENPQIYQVEITEEPFEKEKSVLCRARLLYAKDTTFVLKKSSIKTIIYLQKTFKAKALHSGDRLLINAAFQRPDGAVNPAGFDYATYLRRQSVIATAYISEKNWKHCGKNNSFSMFRMAETAQQKLLHIYRDFGINGDEFAVLAALTLGSKDALHPELRQNFSTSGGMHILAVSGLHVGIVYLVLNFLFSLFLKDKKFKIPKALLIIIFLWCYAFITGLPPSVIRSVLMFSLIAFGSSLMRKSQIYNTISLSAFVMLVINPDFLFDVGFQLSYAAVVAIVYFQPKISKLLIIKSKPLHWIWNLTAVSLAAQIGTAPLAVYYFHQFPNYFLLTNLIAIPAASLIIYGALLLFMVSPVPYLSDFVAYCLNFILKALNYSIEFIHNLPFALTVVSINFWQLLLVTIAVVAFTFYLSNKKIKPLLFSFLSVFEIVLISVFLKYKLFKEPEIIVFSDNKYSHFEILDGRNNYIFSTNRDAFEKIGLNYNLLHGVKSYQPISRSAIFQDGFFIYRNKLFFVLKDDLLKKKETAMPLLVDFLIVCNHTKPRITEILKCIQPKTIIVDKTISHWYAQNIKQKCIDEKIDFYSISDQGAYIQKFR